MEIESTATVISVRHAIAYDGVVDDIECDLVDPFGIDGDGRQRLLEADFERDPQKQTD